MESPKDVRLNHLRAYLLGAMHDGTVRRKTIRISQREQEYVLLIKSLILGVGKRAWTYREGRTRNLYVVEFSKALLDGRRVQTQNELIHYVRGYFDAEGSVASPVAPNPYLYFGQKNWSDIEALRRFLGGLGITCGAIHNPSWRADPRYWRFFVSRSSLPRFAKVVGSWHPRKSTWLRELVSRFF
jgi:hypothetical protein